MPSVVVNGIELYYLDEGSGVPLIFIHGIGCNHQMFSPQFEYFRMTHRIIAPDLRGCGNSGRLTGPIHSILDRQSDDIEKLMDHLSIDRAVFLGTSYGGMLCLHFGLRYPKRVAGMVISDAFSDTRAYGIIEGALYSINLLTFWTSYFPKIWMTPVIGWRYKRWSKAKGYALEVARHLRKHELVLQRLLLLRINFTKYLPNIRFPVLGIVGDDFSIMIRRMQRTINAIPNAELQIIKDSFDPTNLCQVDQYNRLVETFLVKLEW